MTAELSALIPLNSCAIHRPPDSVVFEMSLQEKVIQVFCYLQLKATPTDSPCKLKVITAFH